MDNPVGDGAIATLEICVWYVFPDAHDQEIALEARCIRAEIVVARKPDVIFEKNTKEKAGAVVDNRDGAVVHVGLEGWVVEDSFSEWEALITSRANSCWNVNGTRHTGRCV